MRGTKLTKRSVEALLARGKDYIVFDSELAGFGVRVMPSGKRFFLIQYRRHGRTRRVMLGQFGPITAEMARREATLMLGNARGGGADPATARDRERQSCSMKYLGKRFLDQHVKLHCKPTTQAEYRRSVEIFIDPFFGNQRVRTVTTADVAELHGSMAHIPYQANRTLGVLSKMFNLSEIWGIRDRHSNPCEGIKRYPERKRERFLDSDELQRLGTALQDAEYHQTETPAAISAYRLLILTGCRLSEIQKLKWDYIDFSQSVIRLPDSKTGAKTVYLGTPALEILRAIPRSQENPFVIMGRLKGSHITDLQHPWRRIRKAAGLDNVRIHDLRHTFASGGLLVGEGLPMIGKLLGHTQVQTTARYAHLAADPVKRAADRIAHQLAAALFAEARSPTDQHAEFKSTPREEAPSNPVRPATSRLAA